MNTNRECGCKSFRTCLVCEAKFGLDRDVSAEARVATAKTTYVFDPYSGALMEHKGSEMIPASADERICGVKLYPEFVNEDEELRLVKDLDGLPWQTSVSGRRKQNFGPRANFRGRRVRTGAFSGFPACTRFVQDRFSSRAPCLEGYRTVEQCSIEYRPETGACIEPHVDDCWIWGERVVQLNLLSDAVLTCLPYDGGGGDDNRYNLSCALQDPRVLDRDGEKVLHNPFSGVMGEKPYSLGERALGASSVVRIPLPRRSLLVLHGEARYEWEHCVLREDIASRRLVIAYRELTPPYLPGGRHQEQGREILQRAAVFW